MDPDARMVEVGARQLGLLTTAQLRQCGLTRHQVETRAARSQLMAVRHGVWALAGSVPSPERAILAAVLAAGQGAVASHQSAALLWGLGYDLQVSARRAVSGGGSGGRGGRAPPVLTAPQQRKFTGVTVHQRALPSWQTTRQGRVPVTTPARTIVDLASVTDLRTLSLLTDDLLRRGLLPIDRLRRVVETLPQHGRLTTAPLHQLIADRLPGYQPGDSAWEREMDDLYDKMGLPPAVRQYEITVGGRVYRVDRAIVDLRIAMEWKGYRWHAGRDAFDTAADREADLASVGWQLLGFTYRTSPERVRAAILGAVNARRRLLA